MTPRKRWPNEAENFRLDSIAASRQAKALLLEAVDRDQIKPDGLKIILKVVNKLNQVEMCLNDAKNVDIS